MIRLATQADAQELLQLCNQHEQRVDPDYEPLPLSDIEEAIRGPYEPSHPLVLEENGIRAAVFIQTFTSRNRVEPDLFTIGTAEQTKRVFDAALEWIEQNRKGFEIRTFCNRNDADLTALFEASGLKFTRDYYRLLKPNLTHEAISLPDSVVIRRVEFGAESALLHQLKDRSFAGHFGYIPVVHEEWVQERGQESHADPNGCFVLFENGEPAGFVIMSDFRAEQSGGWVDMIGVLPEHRGKGFGRLLLSYGLNYAASKGYTSVGLSADTGNESGALALYERAGFAPELIWRSFTKIV